MSCVCFHVTKCVWITWINLSVTGHTIGIHDVLEVGSECVGVKECWRRCGRRQTVVERVHTATTLSLRCRKVKNKRKFTTPNPAVWENKEFHSCLALALNSSSVLENHTWLTVYYIVSSHRSFYQSALEQWKFGYGAPGLCDETLVCDWRAAEVKDCLHSFTLLHTYLPLWHLTHTAREQLLHILLCLRQHLQTDKSRVHNKGESTPQL